MKGLDFLIKNVPTEDPIAGASLTVLTNMPVGTGTCICMVCKAGMVWVPE